MTALLDTMTRSELIVWIKTHSFQRPLLSDVMLIRWSMATQKLAEEESANMAELKAIDTKERDRLAVLFNNSKCNDERLELITKIGKYDKQLRDNISKSQKLRKKQEKLDTLYAQIDVQREKERGS